MEKLKDGLFNVCVDRGIIGNNWRIEITESKIVGNSDIAEIVFKTYPPRKRKGYLNSIKINFVKQLVYWDSYSHSHNDRF